MSIPSFMGCDLLENCRALKKRQKEIITYFATEGASNGPAEATNGRP
ncbi:hypothetical protein [Paeniglutamicibacter psychrophenolicus]|nr:hypothetical protein [Paeniglutamicibacter psychrophenolicus]MDQ0094873.1 transposase [Paeniglutamicibacter psychrophenolicus]